MDEPDKTVVVSMDGLSDVLRLYSERTIHIDPDGDLDLSVGAGEELRKFSVSSAMMLRSSPVWRSMLTSGFKESCARSSPVTFPEDDVLTFFLVLLASHMRFPEIPRKITLEQLERLCVFCDKYDCIVVVQPWVDKWIAGLTLTPLMFKPGKDMENKDMWTWIAWTTGDRALVSGFTKYYILHSHTDNAKQLFDPQDQLLDGNLPPAIIGK